MNKSILSVIGIAAALLSLMVVPPYVAAMGANPSTCGNRYNDTFTAFSINYPGGTGGNGSVITLPNNENYTATFTLRAANVSVTGQQGNGSVWYDTTYLGFAEGVCIYNVYPNQSVNVTLTIAHPANQPTGTDIATFTTLTDNHAIQYQINYTPTTKYPNTDSFWDAFVAAVTAQMQQIVNILNKASFALFGNAAPRIIL